MKKLTVALTALIVTGNLNAAHAQDGTVTFTGRVLSDSCTIAGDSKNVYVEFGQVSSIYGARETAIKKDFTLSLENCPESASEVIVTLNAQASPASPGIVYAADYLNGKSDPEEVTYWTIHSKGGADTEALPVNGTTTPDSSFVIHSGKNTLPFYAKFFANGVPAAEQTATPGTHAGEVTYTVSYQ